MVSKRHIEKIEFYVCIDTLEEMFSTKTIDKSQTYVSSIKMELNFETRINY